MQISPPLTAVLIGVTLAASQIPAAHRPNIVLILIGRDPLQQIRILHQF
jgi:hypothetical protein